MVFGLNLFLVFVQQWIYFLLGTGSPQLNYHSPVDIPIYLAANFGELRSNHFHMGIDIKTQGREGFKLYSIEDGYVSRINVSPYGYGLAIYVNHPGGITSVYAHCSALSDKLKKVVASYQYESQSSEIELHFEPHELIVKRGEIIALSGNSGSSSGPHLHFEIRDTHTDAPLNPLHFGFDIKDSRAPLINGIRLYSLDQYGYVLDAPKAFRVFSNSAGKYFMDTVRVSASFLRDQGGLGFAIASTDRFDGFEHVCAPYSIQLTIDGEEFIETKFDKIKFEHTRYLNSYTDPDSRTYHRSFKNVSNPLQLFNARTSGIFKPKQNQAYQIRYLVSDVAGNSATCNFVLLIEDGLKSPNESRAHDPNFFHPDSSYVFRTDDAILEIPIHSSYEPYFRDFSLSSGSVTLECYQRVQEYFVVKLKPLTSYPIRKQYLRVNERKALNTQFKEGWLQASSNYFGKVDIAIDETPPLIKSINVKAKISSNQTNLVWRISDNQSGLRDYGVWIDGKWEILTYESKGDYAYISKDKITPGEHELIVTAKDYCGNEAKLIQKIFN